MVFEETNQGLRYKAPKTKHGKRTISLSPNAAAILREHRRKLLEIRLALGAGKPMPMPCCLVTRTGPRCGQIS